MLIVDEVHHVLAGSHREQRASLNLLKYLANELKISIVAVGTNDAPVAFQTDSQIYSRFAPFELPRWSESEDFRRLLSAFEAVLPLKQRSELTQRPIAQFLIAASAGLLWEISRLLSDAAERAILDGSELITQLWHVRIDASVWREMSSGERGGEMRRNNYKFEVVLTPTDLAALVSFALAWLKRSRRRNYRQSSNDVRCVVPGVAG